MLTFARPALTSLRRAFPSRRFRFCDFGVFVAMRFFGGVAAFSISEHPVVHALLTELEAPILSSTLLLPGDDAPLNDPEAIRERLEKRLDAILDAGACPAEPTSVIDLAVDPPVVARLGRGDPARMGLVAD